MLRRGNAEWVIVGRLGHGKRNDRVLLSSNHPVHGRGYMLRARPIHYPTYTRPSIVSVRPCAFSIHSYTLSALLLAIKRYIIGEIETINRVRYRTGS